MKRTVIGLMATAVVFGAAAPAHAQNALGSTFNIGVFADADQNDGRSQTATFSDSQGATLNPFSHSLSVTDTNNAGGTLNVTSSASASWLNAGEGTVLWRGMGWTHHTNAQTGSRLNGFVGPSPVWSYTFQATTNGTFTLNYDVRATGDPFGLLGVGIEWSGTGGGLDLTNAYTPVAHGTFSRALAAGNTYTIGLSNSGNIFTSQYQRDSSGLMDADFHWTTAVPEPSTVGAFAVAGLAFVARRRRR